MEALRAGASGYVLKVSPGEELTQAITQVAQGRAYVTPLISKNMLSILLEARQEGGGDGAPLTTRQRQVLQLIAEGRTMKEVATMSRISKNCGIPQVRDHAGSGCKDHGRVYTVCDPP